MFNPQPRDSIVITDIATSRLISFHINSDLGTIEYGWCRLASKPSPFTSATATADANMYLSPLNSHQDRETQPSPLCFFFSCVSLLLQAKREWEEISCNLQMSLSDTSHSVVVVAVNLSRSRNTKSISSTCARVPAFDCWNRLAPEERASINRGSRESGWSISVKLGSLCECVRVWGIVSG